MKISGGWFPAVRALAAGCWLHQRVIPDARYLIDPQNEALATAIIYLTNR
jgi:hypothetical protein